MNDTKSLKQYAKEAKLRLKSSFWQDYKSKVEDEIILAERDGLSVSKVKQYYQNKATTEVRGTNLKEEEFYHVITDQCDPDELYDLRYAEFN